ncbi:bifunctional 3-(3-hydroxy-phenyl)propionate/3-hydroxycinnamic acid hydroxylase [Micromonospora sp. NPDC050397]|uniref:bifunctional 3-(3-hydroxy-phenyl)propionate/3-hydroxycinnamic acid hydroxylase MhpA n=1 Tax=Micromonospora sp. NPDC050397 TaxID=3364279 RepID=UPI00384BFCC5
MSVNDDPDVVIVGYGPVGQLLAVLLAGRGWSVTVLERWPRPYPMPRAVAFDGESARILAGAGLGELISRFGEPSGDYTWENADGQELLHFDAAEGLGRSGWPDSTSMYQPGLEAELAALGAALPTLRVLRGYEVVRLHPGGNGVGVVALDGDGGELTLHTGWVVGCDGANSLVRREIATTVTDLGFEHDWLICDVVPDPPREFRPNNLQVCDPARPRTAVSAGPGHRRWEFMRTAGEPLDEFDTAATAWRLLRLFDIHPGNATLERHAVYTFQASFADRWRSGRLLIAGDAAHLMPPFAAQGMSSGFRDAANVAWKLDLVLRGLADEQTLDTYPVERRQHVQHAIGISVNLGRVICQTDPAAAADRDEMMMAVRKRGIAPTRPPSVVESLAEGFLQDAALRPPGAPVGHLVPQGRVTRDGRTALFDEVVGLGFALISTESPDDLLDLDRLRFLEELGVRFARLLPADDPAGAQAPAVVDAEGVYLDYLGGMGTIAVLVRPDFYLFGAARTAAELAALVDDLRQQLLRSDRPVVAGGQPAVATA